MQDFVSDKSESIRRYFELNADVPLIAPDSILPQLTKEASEKLCSFNLEWHIVPSESALPFDKKYVERMYPTSSIRSCVGGKRADELLAALKAGHSKHQGKIVAVETTQKPGYLPGNKQLYGTKFGFQAGADPFARYLGRAGFVNGTRYAHNFPSLREFVQVISDDWKSRSLIPDGYEVRICPPVIFNLVGTIFHPEWSETETPELGFYRDTQGNSTCYAIGCNSYRDFSYVHVIEGEAEWTLLGFRLALIPE